IAAFNGCTPPGPRALLNGEKLLREGKAEAAIERLEFARDSMRGEPRVWNFLGLAYHRAGKLQLANTAYRQALSLERSNAVSVAHYNLGCLLLEQNFVVGAAEQFRSYTLITNGDARGFAKLGAAQSRLRQFA